MKKFIRAILAAGAIATTCCSALAADQDTLKKDIETFMDGYLRLWNAHDAATITQRIYRLGETHPWRTQEGLQAEFDRLKAQGYDRSEITSVIGCVTGTDAGQVELRYARLKADGTIIPPKDHVSVYYVQRFADGWKVTGMRALRPDQKMECPPQ